MGAWQVVAQFAQALYSLRIHSGAWLPQRATQMTTNTTDGEGMDSTTTTTTDHGNVDNGNAIAVDPAEFAKLQAAYEKTQAELEKTKSEAAQRRIAERDAKEQQLKAAEAAGEYEKASQMKDARIAELEAMAPMAERWSAFEAEQKKKVEVAMQGDDLPDFVRTAVNAAAADPLAQLEILNGFRASAAQPPPTKTPSGGGGGGQTADNGPVDWASLNRVGGAELQQAIKKDPMGWNNFLTASTKRTTPSL